MLIKKLQEKSIHTLIIGGGAAGFFTAINLAEMLPDKRIVILERGKEVLTKVKVSGGGRCNVTHAEFIPKELVKNYPRGEKELLGPFHTFMTGDTIDWFEKRGIALKMEEDGRMFPVTDSSQTIIDCFLLEIQKRGVELLKNHSVQNITKENGHFTIRTTQGDFTTENLVVATGSNTKIWKLLEKLNHTIVAPVPSLFTFNIKDKRIADLPGISKEVSIKIISDFSSEGGVRGGLESEGPLLITHWGMSGPGILKLSAWGAKVLSDLNYRFSIQINWLLYDSTEETLQFLQQLKQENGKQLAIKYPQFDLPKRLWQNLITASTISEETKWADVTKDQLVQLSEQLTKATFQVDGKSTFKEEFVTAGGVNLTEINFKTFESKLHQNLYFAGEVLNIDAITGGFNFQNAWTGGFMVAQAICNKSLQNSSQSAGE